MNRQLKRANEKSEVRREREQAKRKAQKQASRILRSARPAQTPKRKASTDKTRSERPKPSVTRPWFVRMYLIFSVVVILLQAVSPPPPGILSFVIYGFFYLTLGYSLCLWLFQRDTERALVYTIGGGVLLALLVEGLKLVIPTPVPATGQLPVVSGPNLLYTVAALPGLVLGAFLARTIHRRLG